MGLSSAGQDGRVCRYQTYSSPGLGSTLVRLVPITRTTGRLPARPANAGGDVNKRQGRAGGLPRTIVNVLFYLLRTSTQWRLLPRDYPPWTARLLLLSAMAQGRPLGASESRFAQTTAQTLGVVNPAQVRGLSTANRSRLPKAVACGAMTAARRSRGANGISWWTPKA